MRLINEYIYEIKKSKFIGLYYEVTSKEEIEEILAALKREHKKAKHMPYAYKIGPLAKKTDDKEPANTAGLPIYNLLEMYNMDNSLVVVIRYFGGIKLGAGPLTRSYKEAALGAINNK